MNLKYMKVSLFEISYKKNLFHYVPVLPVPIIDFWGPYAEWDGVGLCGRDERMDAMQLSVFHSVLNRAHGMCLSLPGLRTLSTRFFLQKTVWYSRYMIWLIFT